jgi:hypothetical protein
VAAESADILAEQLKVIIEGAHMRNQSFFRFILGISVVALLGACTGPKGDLGPTGAQGQSGAPASATYYYNSNFDTQANLSEWSTYQSGGTGSIQVYLDNSAFNSPSEAMGVSITGTVFSDSLVYTNLSFDTSKDIWVEFDWLLTGFFIQTEIVVNIANKNKASIGYNGSNLYLTNSSTQYTVGPSSPASSWHHVKIDLNPVTGLSTYWLDGMSLGTNYTTSITVPGSPPTGSYLAVKLSGAPGDRERIDNLQCYHY